MENHTQQHPDFLRPKDLLMLEKAELEGDVVSLHEHIRLIEDSLPTVQATRPQAADEIVQRRLPYLRQVVAELTLQSQVLAAATARVQHTQNGAADGTASAVHAMSTAWEKWQRVAEALGYTVSENGTLHEHSEGTRDASQSTGSNSGLRQEQQQNYSNPNQPTQAAATATVTAPEPDPRLHQQQQQPVLRAVDGNNASDVPSIQENLSNKTMDQLTDNLIPREAFEEAGEASYLEAFAVHCMDCTAEDAAKMPWKTLPQAVSSGVPENVLEGLLWPCTPAEFAASIRQHSALLIQRESSRSFYSEIFSSEELWKLLKEREVQYGTNVDVTLFTAEQRRQTFNDNLIKGQPAGGGQRKSKKRKRNGATQAQQTDSETSNIADAEVVRQRYSSGCSVRLLHPQQWVTSVAQLLAPLEQLLQCPLGCNVYLTPADSQGFAPHFDDVDVYILQVEGAKRWRVYAPLSGHALPRYSSRDFDDMEIGEPLLDTVLRPGDLLYLPRGTIHQAAALSGHHSMHLTVSAEQRRTWADFMEIALQEALEETRKTCFASRASMSPWLYQCCGLLHSNRLCPTSRDMPPEYSGGEGSLPASVLTKGRKNGKSMNGRKDETAVGLVSSATFEKFQKLPGSSSLLEPSELRQLRAAFSCTVDRLMHAMRRSMHAALDRAADRAVAKFTAERLPPLWLQGAPQNSKRPSSNRLKPARVNLRAAYDEGNGEQAAADLRIPAATLAVLLDSGDPECLEVRHCMNNSCDQHASAAAAGNSIGPPTSGHSNNKDLEEPQEPVDDVLKLPFFLIPRSIGPAVAKRLLNIKHCESPPVNGTSDAKSNSSSTKGSYMHVVQKKQKNGKKAKRGHAYEAEKSAQALKVATQGSPKDDKGEVIGEEVWEAGSGWAEGETNVQVGDAEDAEESKELVTEVECTLADLGIWVQ